MPLPKRRHSNQRTRLRRTHYKLTSMPSVCECPRCHQPALSHHVCPSCGYYKGRLVLEIKDKTSKAEQ